MSETKIMNPEIKPPKLLLVQNGHTVWQELKSETTIGRNTADCQSDIHFSAVFVSRHHGIISQDAYGFFYIDTNSTSGTYCNGKKLEAGYKKYLADGDVLQIFNQPTATAADVILIIFSSSYAVQDEEKTIMISQSAAEINIGRAVKNAVTLGEDTVSENHASFFKAASGWAVVDHQSKNGVFVNNQKIPHPVYLSIGDCIRISNAYFIFLGDRFLSRMPVSVRPQTDTAPMKNNDFSGLPELNIHIMERSVWQRTKKLMLLQNIQMTVKAGEMVLILGGSGAGKTTFMNAVMGYEKAQGKILHGNTDIYEDYESMKYKIGFVPQQDLLREHDTVFYTLENAAEMKLPPSMSKSEKLQKMEYVLQTLGLQRERDNMISKLSGGQRKRMSIAIEYIADPSLFFLDEPDSGLDGMMARQLMHHLRNIADEGKIVMLISHAPDRVAELFDKVIVLAKSVHDNCGHLAFFGTVKDACHFFETDTLEEIVKRINREDEGGDGLSDYYIEKYSRSISS
ncbi:MAG: FHA domain-containing protein [Oscillospiraceae bacterium]